MAGEEVGVGVMWGIKGAEATWKLPEQPRTAAEVAEKAMRRRRRQVVLAAPGRERSWE
ncbi:hypothetical protein TIFTF001_002418 [Ficus carica]|uniref:Uncharacterized protein n=1 Tax=Ficus carica TaxID=3494 RepID=A0AA87ZBF3_FICCA|nr:hypothetical protein TIFTF001_002418 [Ficus carica]